jgi:hypothetical protein
MKKNSRKAIRADNKEAEANYRIGENLLIKRAHENERHNLKAQAEDDSQKNTEK